MKNKIVVVGSLNVDFVANLQRMPVEGETILGTSFATYPGGKGANQAVAAARLGGNVSMVGALGQDIFAERLHSNLLEAGVHADCVSRVPGESGSAVILVTAHGGNAIVVNPGANVHLRPEQLDACRELLMSATVILCQLEIPLDTVMRLGAIAQEAGVPFILDPAPAPAEPLPAELLRLVTWLTPNETETKMLLDQLSYGHIDLSTNEGIEEAAHILRSNGPRNVVLKRGEHGAYVAGDDVSGIFIPPFAVKAIDTTAAGDAFNGGFAYALAEHFSPIKAAEFATAVAAVSVTRVGAQPSMPTLHEVEAFCS